MGSRGSRLAMLQTELVVNKLKGKYPAFDFVIKKIKTSGDRLSQAPLAQIWGQGVFVKELEQALLDRSIDLAVHSLKDMPSATGQGLKLAAVLQREDARDVLVTRSGKPLAGLPAGARVGTGSLRRAAQIRMLRPDIEVCPIRGNVDTRLNKVQSGEVDGAVLAAAALIRLSCQERIAEYLSPDVFLPAVGQGALVVETRDADEETVKLVSTLDNLPTRQAVTAERALLAALGGGCRTPIAALGTVSSNSLELKAMVASPDGKVVLRAGERGALDAPEELGRLVAGKLLESGARQVLQEMDSES